jgi:hypothetical protein
MDKEIINSTKGAGIIKNNYAQAENVFFRNDEMTDIWDSYDSIIPMPWPATHPDGIFFLHASSHLLYKKEYP